MFDQINTLLNKIFSNEESVIFSLLIFAFLLVLYIFGGILTPFIVSLIFAYLLIGLSKNFIKYGLSELVSLVISYVIFILTGLGFLVWLIPLIFQQTQAFFLEVPIWLNNFRSYVENLVQSNQELISSDQISSFFTELVGRLSSLSQGVLDASISIQTSESISLFFGKSIRKPLIILSLSNKKKNTKTGIIIKYIEKTTVS